MFDRYKLATFFAKKISLWLPLTCVCPRVGEEVERVLEGEVGRRGHLAGVHHDGQKCVEVSAYNQVKYSPFHNLLPFASVRFERYYIMKRDVTLRLVLKA